LEWGAGIETISQKFAYDRLFYLSLGSFKNLWKIGFMCQAMIQLFSKESRCQKNGVSLFWSAGIFFVF